jgi:outer membrane biosynthesis protein TonB
MLGGVVALALGGFAAAGAFAVDGLSFALTTTVGADSPTPTVPAPDPAPTPPPPPPPPPKHVSPPPAPPPPAPSPPPPAYVAPPPAYVAPPPAPVVTPPTRPLALAKKPHRRHHHAAKKQQPVPAPIPVSRGAGGPARADVVFLATPVALHTRVVSAISPTGAGAFRARLLFLIATALGLILVVASTLPGQALRPAIVHEVVAVHRIDLALVGFSIVIIVGALYLLAA